MNASALASRVQTSLPAAQPRNKYIAFCIGPAAVEDSLGGKKKEFIVQQILDRAIFRKLNRCIVTTSIDIHTRGIYSVACVTSDLQAWL